MKNEKQGYTPGPWKAEKSHSDFSGSYYLILKENPEKGGTNIIAKTHLNDIKVARLISAAPQLLEALESLLKAVKDAPGDGPLNEIEAAEKILKKAGGEK